MIETVLKNVRQTEEAAQAIRLNAEIGAAEIRNEADKRAAGIPMLRIEGTLPPEENVGRIIAFTGA